jgi:hypothetical protein
MKFKNMGRRFVDITYRAAGVRERRPSDILWQAYRQAQINNKYMFLNGTSINSV